MHFGADFNSGILLVTLVLQFNCQSFSLAREKMGISKIWPKQKVTIFDRCWPSNWKRGRWKQWNGQKVQICILKIEVYFRFHVDTHHNLSSHLYLSGGVATNVRTYRHTDLICALFLCTAVVRSGATRQTKPLATLILSLSSYSCCLVLVWPRPLSNPRPL